MKRQAWLDGVFVEGGGVPAHDLSVQRGLGLFETMGAADGRLPLWDRHLARMQRSAEACSISAEIPAGLRAVAEELLQRCGAPDGVVRLTLLVADRRDRSRVLLTCRARERRAEPLRIGRGTLRRGPGDWTAAHKLTSRAFYDLARHSSAVSPGQPPSDDTLIESTDGRPLETTYGNLFVAIDGRLWTPPAFGDLLPGVARAALIEALGRDVVTLADVPSAALDHERPFWVTNAVYGPRLAFVPRAVAGSTPPEVPDDLAVLDVELRAAWRGLLVG